jgi:hypothetical protein
LQQQGSVQQRLMQQQELQVEQQVVQLTGLVANQASALQQGRGQ